MPDNFTWIPFFEELAKKLLSWRERQKELIAFLESLRSPGIPITPLTDRDVQGNRFLLEEIDPFTMMGVINRRITDEARFGISSAMKNHFGIEAPVPSDFDGIPTLIPMASWFFGFKSYRGIDDVQRLWRLLEVALLPSPIESEAFVEALDQVLKQPGVNVNITMGLFWARPTTFISLDRPMRDFLEIALPPGGLTAAFYRDAVARIRTTGKTPVSVSHEAWLLGNRPSPPKTSRSGEPQDGGYWVLGAYWEDLDPPDQTTKALFIALVVGSRAASRSPGCP